MILLLPGNPTGHWGREVKNWPRHLVGWLVTRTRSMTTMLHFFEDAFWGVDNECYSRGDCFDFDAYLRLLWRVRKNPGRCLFTVAPDVYADAEATARLWQECAPTMWRVGLPLAYVAQDGLEELPELSLAARSFRWATWRVPWLRRTLRFWPRVAFYDCLFVGGSTEYKLGPVTRRLVREAKEAGLWVHMGRVNSVERMRYAWQIGVDSVDGTGWARRPIGHLRWALRELRWQRAQLPLPLSGMQEKIRDRHRIRLL